MVQNERPLGRRSLIGLVSIFGVSLLAAECQTEPRPPTPDPDGGAVEDAGADAPPAPAADAARDAPEPDGGQPPAPLGKPCERACQTLSRLGCSGGEDVDKCVATCENVESSDVARFCPEHVSIMIGRPAADGGVECDPAELERAFSACE